jgi:hypothetical protein
LYGATDSAWGCEAARVEHANAMPSGAPLYDWRHALQVGCGVVRPADRLLSRAKETQFATGDRLDLARHSILLRGRDAVVFSWEHRHELS